MIAVAGAMVACVAVIVIATAAERLATKALVLLFFGAATIFPRLVAVVVPSTDTTTGLAPASVTVTTYSVAVVVSAGSLMMRRRASLAIPVTWLVLLLLLPIAVIGVWEGTVRQWSGVLHLAVAMLAWPLGAFVAAVCHKDERTVLLLMRTLLAVMTLQAVIGAAQLSGATLPTTWTAATSEVLSGNRVTGTLGNPANLSKVSYLFLVLALPGTIHSGHRVRRAAVILAGVCLVVTTMTVSRANLAACVVTLGLWFVLAPRSLRLGSRLVAFTAVAAILAATAGATIQRYLDDPEGSVRPELLASALARVGEEYVGGVGVNSYVAALRQVDAVTAATGLPVHNAFLYLLIELGVFFAALFVWPWMRLFSAGARSGTGTVHSRLILCFLPGLAVIAVNGYGVLSTFILPVLVWVTAFVQKSRDLQVPTLPERLERGPAK